MIQKTARLLLLAFAISTTAAATLAAAGDLDPTFNGTGKVVMSLAADHDSIDDIAIQPDGKIVTVGRYWAPGLQSSSVVVARFNTNGSLDTSFDENGFVTAGFGYQHSWASAVVLQPDGKIVICGSGIRNIASGSEAIVARFHTNGALDTTFHHDGLIEEFWAPFPGSFWSSSALSVAIQADGKIVVVGGSAFDTFVLRFNTDGTRDRRFGHLGKAIISHSPEGEAAFSVKIQPDQKLVVLGHYSNPEDAIYVFRLNPHGKIDTTFDGDGLQTISFINGLNYAFDVELQADGKIVVGGHYGANDSGPAACAMARLNLNGSFDSSFDGDGKLTIATTAFREFAMDLAVQSDGKLVLAGGTYDSLSAPGDFLILRRNSDGSPDLTFGQAGRVRSSIVTASDQASALSIQSDGKIVAAGTATGAGGASDSALARYLGQ